MAVNDSNRAPAIRDLAVAAPLKPYRIRQMEFVGATHPRPSGRGPIEAPVALPLLTPLYPSIRDLAVAAPLKLLDRAEHHSVERRPSAT